MKNLTVKSIDEALKGEFWSGPNHAAQEIIDEAVKRGYIVRLSHTQAQWTEGGLNKARRELDQFNPSDPVIRQIAVNDTVVKLGSDYTAGRRGVVHEERGDRVRVKWTHTRDGVKMTRNLRTWVNRKRLALCNFPAPRGWSYKHAFGVIAVKGWGLPFLVITEHKFYDGEPYGYNYYKLGKTFRREEVAKTEAEALNKRYALPRVFSPEESESFLLEAQRGYPAAEIAKK